MTSDWRVTVAEPKGRKEEENGAMTTDLAHVAAQAAENGLARLDPYAGGIADEGPRVSALALVSCGYRAPGQGDRPGLPKASRRGDPKQLHLHDPDNRAPGLAAALESSQHRSLLITFPLDDPKQFVIQRFTRYSQTKLEVYGDEAALTEITPKEHVRHAAGTDEYARLVKTCKADTRIYFCLAKWAEDGPRVVFPDGLGVYAIRTTSRHSLRSILGSLGYTGRFTRGRIAGLPFVLEVDHREVAGPDGTKRTVPVLTITTRPPAGIELSSRTFAQVASQALQEGASLMLPAPDAESWEEVAAEGPPPVDEPTPEELKRLEEGGAADYEHYVKQWHALARGTAWESDDGRAAFLAKHTNGAYTSLSSYLHEASDADAAALIAELAQTIAGEVTARDARRYSEIFGADDPDAPSRIVDTQTGEVLSQREAF